MKTTIVKPKKETYTREEVKEFICKEFMDYMEFYFEDMVFPLQSHIEEWLEKNLE